MVEEEESILVVNPHHKDHQTTVFLREKDPLMEHWNGRRLGVDDAPKTLGVDKAYSNGDFQKEILKCLEGAEIRARSGP